MRLILLFLLFNITFISAVSAQEVDSIGANVSQTDIDGHSNIFIYKTKALLNIRAEASTKAEVIGKVNEGVSVYVDGRFLKDSVLDKWVLIRKKIDGDEIGWVYSNNLEFKEEYIIPERDRVYILGKSRTQISQMLVYALLVSSILGCILGIRGIFKPEYKNFRPLIYFIQIMLVFETLAFSIMAYWTYNNLTFRYLYDSFFNRPTATSMLQEFYPFFNAAMFFIFAIGYVVMFAALCIMAKGVSNMKHSWLLMILPIGLIAFSCATGNGGFIDPMWMTLADISNGYVQASIYGSIIMLIVYSIWIFVSKENVLDAIVFLIVYIFSIVGLLLIIPTTIIIFAVLLGWALYSALSTATGALSGLAGGGSSSASKSSDVIIKDGEEYEKTSDVDIAYNKYKSKSSGREIIQ